MVRKADTPGSPASPAAGDAQARRGGAAPAIPPAPADAPPSPDTAAAIDFLKRWEPDGPWVLTAIDPSKKGIETRTFEKAGKELADWLDRHNGRWNIYFSVNRCREPLSKKAEKSDIAAAVALHVDLDPRVGEDLEKERDRILGLLRQPPGGLPAPTVIVFSGGGYQGFWRLKEPVSVGGEPEKAESVEDLNAGIEAVLGADSCHNIDRIMRLPGTVNVPDARKEKKGRVPVLAELVEWHDERAYEASRFAATARRTSPSHIPAGRPVAAPGNVERLSGVDALDEWGVPDRIKVIIVQGRHPDEDAKKDDSRSSWLFDAVCGLVRVGVPDEVIFSVLMDPDFGISGSVLDKGRNSERYAMRQIERARFQVAVEAGAVERELTELNERHAVLTQEGGKTRVLTWEKSELDHSREVPVLQSFEDFRNRYMNRHVEVPSKKGTARVPLGKWWLEHPWRREFWALRFLPGQPVEVDGYLNMWRGFSVGARKGDWSLMEAHVKEILAAGDATHANYIMKWVAWAVQRPDMAAEVALVLRGGRGTGKGMFARTVKRLFGQHGLQVTSPTQLTGRFNAHLRDCCLLFADEAVAPGDKAAESVLKGLITEPELTIEGKGVNAVQARNRLHVVMASNDEWVVPAGMDERRFAVFEVSSAKAGDHEYFAALQRQLDDGGHAAMLHDLLALPLGDWHPRREVPATAGLRRQKTLSLSPFDQWLLGVLESGVLPGARPARRRGAARTVLSGDLPRDPGLFSCMRQSSPRLREISDQRLTAQLKEWGCVSYSVGGPRGWTFPPLADMRATWEERYWPGEWSAQDEWGYDHGDDDDPPF